MPIVRGRSIARIINTAPIIKTVAIMTSTMPIAPIMPIGPIGPIGKDPQSERRRRNGRPGPNEV